MIVNAASAMNQVKVTRPQAVVLAVAWTPCNPARLRLRNTNVSLQMSSQFA